MGLKNIPIPRIVALLQVFSVELVTSVHPLPMLWYFIFSPGWYILCCCIHVTSIPYFSDKCVISPNFDSPFSVRTFIVEKFTFRLHFRRLAPVACLSTSTWCSIGSHTPCLPAWRAMRFVKLLVDIFMFILQLLNKIRGSQVLLKFQLFSPNWSVFAYVI